jgi:hypothetical protein
MMQMMSLSNNSNKANKSKSKRSDNDDDDYGDDDDTGSDAAAHHSSLYRYYNRTTKTFCNPEPAVPLQNPKLSQYGLRIRTTLPRFSQYYTITLELDVPKSSQSSSSSSSKVSSTSLPEPKQCKVTQTWSIGQFFDHQGYFDEIGFANAVEELLVERFDAEKYDTSQSTATDAKKRD